MGFSCKPPLLCSLHAELCWQIRNHSQWGWGWALTGTPRTWSPQRGQVPLQAGMWHVAAVSPPKALLPAGHNTVQFNLTLVWPLSHTGRRVWRLRFHFQSSELLHAQHTATTHCSPTADSPQRQKAQTSQIWCFSSPALLHMLLTSTVSSATSQTWWKSW